MYVYCLCGKKEGFRTQEERLKREWEAQLGFCVEELRLVRLYYTPVELSEEEIRTLFCDPGIDEFSFVLAVPEGFRALRVGRFALSLTSRRFGWRNVWK